MTKHCSFLSILALLTSATGLYAADANPVKIVSSWDIPSSLTNIRKISKSDDLSVPASFDKPVAKLQELSNGDYVVWATPQENNAISQEQKRVNYIFRYKVSPDLSVTIPQRSSIDKTFLLDINAFRLTFSNAKDATSVKIRLDAQKKRPASNQPQYPDTDSEPDGPEIGNPKPLPNTNKRQKTTSDLEDDEDGQDINTDNDGSALTNFLQNHPKTSISIAFVAVVAVAGIISTIFYTDAFSNRNTMPRRRT